MENDFEKQQKSVQEKYDDSHTKGRELLGGLYNEKAFDQIMGSFLNDSKAFREELDILETELATVENENEKDEIRKEWMKKNNALGEIFDIADEEE